MRNYDFQILSPQEFENFSRDLLQKHLKITLESFKSGKDQGIDARYSNDKNNEIIVQAKRYKDLSALVRQLKKEVPKIKKLKPNRYVLTTTVSLSPHNKTTILDLFKPFIKRNSDICGKDDLNNLLNKYPDVEEDYYKLWISSTDIIKRILHNNVYTQSIFDKEDIRSDIQKYVTNPSLKEAEKILREHHVVIISGIPGIGKTTLARALSYKLMANNQSPIEFISLGQNIKEAFDVFERSKAQLFFFDDFLGSNFLVNFLEKNEDRNITQFIEKISKSNNKYLICTTREYILRQAKQSYERLNKSDLLEASKYVVDLETYTSLIKAKILYNHLFFSSLTEQYFNEVVSGRNYLKIIQHPNFNPRIIELVTKDRFVNKIPPAQYIPKVESYLSNPEEIWRDAYESQISELAQITLLIIVACGTPIIYEDLLEATEQYIKHNWHEFHFSSSKFDKALKELENTFLQTDLEKISYKEEGYVIEFQNSSVQDFLQIYIANHLDFISKLFSSSIYLNQLFHIFSLNDDSGKTRVTGELANSMSTKIINEFNSFKFSSLIKTIYSGKNEALVREEATVVDKIDYIIRNIDLEENKSLRSFLLEKFCSFPYERIADHNLETYVRIAKKLKIYRLQVDYNKMLQTILENINFVSSLNVIFDFREICPQVFDNLLTLGETKSRISSIVKDELDNATINYTSFEDINSFADEVKAAINNYNLKLNEELEELEEEVGNLEAMEDAGYEYLEDTYKEEATFKRQEEKEELKAIDNLFDSLEPDTA